MPMQYKQMVIEDLKTVTESGKYYISGYANTKGHADSYGDIPQGDNVYELSRIKMNPVMLVGHYNDPSAVMGNFTELEEDSRGLRFTALLRDPEQIAQPTLKDVIRGYIDGFIRALSIGGRWEYDERDSRILKKAHIYEISGVAVPADPESLTSAPMPKSAGFKDAVLEYLNNKTIENYNKMREVLR